MAEHIYIWHLLEDILLILALAGLVVPALQYLRMSPVLSYLICGLIIGPNALGLLTDSYPWLAAFVITDKKLIHILAELGVVFLLFMIGLELTFEKLWKLKKFVLGLGGLQILVTAIVICVIALQFDNSLQTSIILGMALALSSTAIIMQIMMDKHMISRPTGQICFSVLLMQDLAVVPILVVAGVFAGHGEGSIEFILLKSFGTAIVVIAGMFFLGKVLLRPALQILSPAKNSEWLLAISLFFVIGAAALTQMAGLSAALGAFLAGLLIGETDYRHEIEIITEPVKGLLMGIFFLSVGMAINLSEVVQHPFWLPMSILGVFVIKAVVFFPLALLFSIPRNQAIQSSIMLAQCGEFALIVIGIALTGDLLSEENAQFFLLVVAVSMLITPLTTKLAPIAQKLVKEHYNETEPSYTLPAGNTNHIIIAGFGRIGRSLADILERETIPYIGIDIDGNAVASLREDGYPVLYGNARHVKIWKKLRVEQARAIVITIDQYEATNTIIKALRKNYPDIPIFARCRDEHTRRAEKPNTTFVVEKSEATRQLARALLKDIGIDKEAIQLIIKRHREDAFPHL